MHDASLFNKPKILPKAGLESISTRNIDILAAKNAGTFSIGCSYGLSPHTLEIVPPDVLIHKPVNLMALLVM